MATIENAVLKRQGLGGGISRMTVTYTVKFTDVERQLKPYWTERIQLWGDEEDETSPAMWGITFPDHSLYHAPTSGFPTGDGSTLNRKREFDIATGWLDEDYGRDEVYAKITITPRMPTSGTAKTNSITGYF